MPRGRGDPGLLMEFPSSELLLATFREHGGSFDCALSKLPLMANSVTVRFPFALLRVRVAGADQWVRCYINLLN